MAQRKRQGAEGKGPLMAHYIVVSADADGALMDILNDGVPFLSFREARECALRENDCRVCYIYSLLNRITHPEKIAPSSIIESV